MCVCARATCAVCDGAVVHRPTGGGERDRERPVVGGIIVQNGFEGRSFSTTIFIFPDEIWQCRFCTAATTAAVVTLGRPAPTENNNCTSSHDNAHRRSNITNITIFVTFCVRSENPR